MLTVPGGCWTNGIGEGCGIDEVTTGVFANGGSVPPLGNAMGPTVGVAVGVGVGVGVEVGVIVGVAARVGVHVGSTSVAVGSGVGGSVGMGLAGGGAVVGGRVGVTTTVIATGSTNQTTPPITRRRENPTMTIHLLTLIHRFLIARLEPLLT